MAASPRLILASGSPRRSDLLREAGFSFETIKPEVEEIEDDAVPVHDLTAMNARLKADAVARDRDREDAVVLAADTLVLLGDTVLGKPTDRPDAARMLAELNGRTHQVFTAVAIVRRSHELVCELSVATEVVFKNLTDREMAEYHDRIDPMDKAGAYGAQDHGELIVEKMSGSMTNVIGLPMDEVVAALAAWFGITPET
ncbi:MAG: Maf family protein [Verrucomicrobiales bacterium]